MKHKLIKIGISLLLALISSVSSVSFAGGYTIVLFNGQTTTGSSASVPTVVVSGMNGDGIFIQASITGTTAVAASITVYCDNDSNQTLATPVALITLGNGVATSDVAGFGDISSCPVAFATVNSISGTGASIILKLGV